jgi:hypothetical protein
MKDLAVRLAALDADAGAALRVIAYFDSLVEAHAGLQSIVRGAAVLADCPARLIDPQRRVRIRVTTAGVSAWQEDPPDKAWMCTPVGAPSTVSPGSGGGAATLWLEREGPPGPVEAMILERAASAARAVLDRTRGRAPAADPASAELLLDASAPPDVRLQAARRLGLPDTAYVVARDDETVVLSGPLPSLQGRAGVGPPTPILDLPASWAAAKVALRFAAEGTEEDPGTTIVHSAELGGLALLAEVPAGPATPDLKALDHAASAAPWVLKTLHTTAMSISLRAAATTLRVHHSTLQDRITHAEHLLGWNVREPGGRLRLQVALALRRLQRHP